MIEIMANEHIPKSLNRKKSQEPQLFGPHSSLLNFDCEGLSWEAPVASKKGDILEDDLMEESSFIAGKTSTKAPMTPKTPKKSNKTKLMKEKEIPDDLLLSPKSRNNGSSRRKISRSRPELKNNLETQRVESEAHKERIIKKALSSQKGNMMTPLKMSTSQALDDLNLRFAASQCMHAPTDVIIDLNPDEMTQTTDISKLTLPPELDYSTKQNPFNSLSDIACDHLRPPSRMDIRQQLENEPHQLPARIQEEQEMPSEDRDTCPKPPGRNSSFTRSAPRKTSSFSQMASNFVGKGAALMHAAARKVETSLLSETSWENKEGGTTQVADESEKSEKKTRRRSSSSRSKSRENSERSRSRSGTRTRPSSNGDEKEKPTPRRATKALLGLNLATKSTAEADRTKPATSSQSLPVTTMSPPTLKLAGSHLEEAKQTSLRPPPLNAYQPRSSREAPSKPSESNSKLSKSVSSEKSSPTSKSLSSKFEEYDATASPTKSKSSKSLTSRSSGQSPSSRALLGSAIEGSKKSSRSSRISLKLKSSRSSMPLSSKLEKEKHHHKSKPKSSKSLAYSRSSEHEGSSDGKPKSSRMLSPKQSSRHMSMSKSPKSLASKSRSEESSSSKTRSETSSEPTSPDPAFGDDKTEQKTTPVLMAIKETQVETSLPSNGYEKKKPTPRRATKALLGLKLPVAAKSTSQADSTKPATSSQSLPVTTTSSLTAKLAGSHLEEGEKQTSLRPSLNAYQPRSAGAVPLKPIETNSKSSKAVSSENSSRTSRSSSSKFEDYDATASPKPKSSKSLASRSGEKSSALEESKKLSRSSRTLGYSALEESKKLWRSSGTLGSALEKYDAAASPKPKSSKLLASRVSGKSRSSALEESKESSRSSRTLGSSSTLEESKKLWRSSGTLGASTLEEPHHEKSSKSSMSLSSKLEIEKHDTTSKPKLSKSLASSRSSEHEGSIDGKPKGSRMLMSPKQSSRKLAKSKSVSRSLTSKSHEKCSSSETRNETSSEPTSPDPADTSTVARKEDEETVEIHVFDENDSKAVEVEGGEEGSLHFYHGFLGDFEECDENSERRERSDYSGEAHSMVLKGAPVDEEDEMSVMISAEGASPARSPRKIKFMPKALSDGGDAYSDIMSTVSVDKSMPSLTDFSMEDFSVESEDIVLMNDSQFSGLKKGMGKPSMPTKKEIISPGAGKSRRVDKSSDNQSPVSKSWRTLRRSVNFIRETKKRAMITRNQRRTIVEDNPRYDDDIDSTSSPCMGLRTALAAQLGSGVKPHVEVVDGKTRLVFELTSAESSMDLEKIAQALSAHS